MEKEFEVQKLTNGKGNKHLVVITEPAIIANVGHMLPLAIKTNRFINLLKTL